MRVKSINSSTMIQLKYCLCALVGVLLLPSVFAQLSLSPREIVVKDFSHSQKVFVTHDEKPVLPGEITSIVSGIFKTGNQVPEKAKGTTHFSDYSFMFEFSTNEDGSITLTPNKGLLEFGSYDLFVHTIYGIAVGSIDANMRDLSLNDSLPPVMAPRFVYEISLPDYSYGQEISIDLNPDGENIYSWYIDGEVHSSGLGKTSFRARPEIGSHEISFVARNPDGVVVSTWSDTIEVFE